jgi:hypothetical protein
MKDITHKQLTRLVVEYGTIPMHSKYLKDLMEFSIEPDQINKQKIAENLFESLSVPFKWLVDHTIKAKKMAIQSIQIAQKEKKEGSEAWIRHLGWSFHYIADWATPHHSPKSKSNPIPAMAGLGALFGGILGGLSEASKKDKKKFIDGIAKGSLIGAGVMGAAGAIDLAINHSKFENECDRRWNDLKVDTLYSKFESKKISIAHFPTQADQMNYFKELMTSIRNFAEDFPSDWIFTCSKGEFIEYMIKIAVVMDFAAQIILGSE